AKGIFTKELETALLDGDIDVAVHSMKDMPSVLPEGLMLAPPPAREDWHDVLVTAGPLPEKPVIGTGSLRRQVQIRTLYPQASLQDIRGNVDTRIRKMKEGQYDGIIVAAAGLNRLGITEDNAGIQITPLVDAFIPAPAQGILAAELRCQDTDTLKLLENAADHTAAIQMKAERRFLVVLEGSCHIPIGAHAQIDGTGIQIDMVGIYGDEAGKAVSGRFSGPADTPEAVGEALALRLKADYQKKYPEGSCE
ncbi:MAG: hydroxymethylbilane synthase, partial [Eubacteriaceae bacterium]